MAVTVRLSNGDKVAGTIVDGKTYLADGSRVPVNSIVDTGVWWCMENDRKWQELGKQRTKI